MSCWVVHEIRIFIHFSWCVWIPSRVSLWEWNDKWSVKQLNIRRWTNKFHDKLSTQRTINESFLKWIRSLIEFSEFSDSYKSLEHEFIGVNINVSFLACYWMSNTNFGLLQKRLQVRIILYLQLTVQHQIAKHIVFVANLNFSWYSSSVKFTSQMK